MLIAWGQFIDHDITLTSETKDPNTGKTPKCCDDGPGAKHPNCLPIEIPHNDHFYKAHKQRCMNFVRSQSGLRLNCRLGPRNRYNMVTILQFYLNISLSKFFVIFFSKLHISPSRQK